MFPLRVASGWSVVVLLLARPVAAQQTPADSVRLEDVVVTASRTTNAPRLRAASADRLSADELGRRGIVRLEEALRLIAATGFTGTGAAGGASSVFLRGVSSSQTLILIDGIRVNDANAFAGSLLGGFELSPDDRVEVVRGPQSTLYGGAAMGGVIAIGGDQPEPSSFWTGRMAGGSFDTWRGQLGGGVRAGRTALSGSASFVDTRNQRPSNDYDQRTEHLGIDHRASERLRIGATFRGLQQSYTSPGDLRTTNTTPVGNTRFENHLGTAYADLTLTRRWSTRLTAGLQRYYLRGTSRFDGGDEFVSRVTETRWVLDWQHQVAVRRGLEVAAGLNREWASVDAGDGPRDERLWAEYAEASLTPAGNLALTAGLRNDDYSSFGAAVTGRVTAALFIPAVSGRVRATWGTGFLPPSLAARYGSAFQRGNPDIRPERSTGWDVGADLFLSGGRGVIGATFFENRLRDLIGFEDAPFPELGRSVNVARARTRGVELTTRLATGPIDLRASYTYLEAKDLSATDPAQERLIRRPRHALGTDLVWSALAGLDLGAGLTAALDRQDTDFNVFPAVRVDPGDYADVRAQAAYRLRREMTIRLVAANLFDTRYEEVYGFPTLGRRVSLSLELGRR